MSESFSIYLINEEELPYEVTTQSDEEMLKQLIEVVEKHGTMHQVVEMTEDDFIDALESIDNLVEGNRLFPNCAMNNSPHEILDKNSETPFFGYFNSAQVQQLLYLFESLDEDKVDTIESVESHSEVFHAFFEAVQEALDNEDCIAVVHG
jgi:hypothetical protein